jgi:hypothetical protein
MAKPKFPKKTDGGQEAVSPTNTPAPVSTSNQTPAEAATAAMPVTQASTSEPRKAEPRKTARTSEIVKTDSRSNLVPINMNDEIRRLAYLLSERRGFEAGHETEDWLAAEHEVLRRYRQQSA